VHRHVIGNTWCGVGNPRARCKATNAGGSLSYRRPLLADSLGIDRLESFGAKFSRTHDTLIDKLIPAVLDAAGEPVAAAIDNLGRMERLALLHSADAWLVMRRLRNRLVHEYIDQPADLAPALELACDFTERMHRDFQAIRTCF